MLNFVLRLSLPEEYGRNVHIKRFISDDEFIRDGEDVVDLHSSWDIHQPFICQSLIDSEVVSQTIVGNIMVQALGRGTIRSVGEMREIISRSVEIKEYFPNDKETWDKAYNRFCQIAMRLNNRQNMPNQEN